MKHTPYLLYMDNIIFNGTICSMSNKKFGNIVKKWNIWFLKKGPLHRTRRGQLGKKLIQPPKVWNKAFTSCKGIIFIGWLLHLKSNIKTIKSQIVTAVFSFHSNYRKGKALHAFLNKIGSKYLQFLHLF